MSARRKRGRGEAHAPDLNLMPLMNLLIVLIPLMLLSLGVRLTGIRWNDAWLGVVGGAVCPVAGLAAALALAPRLGPTDPQRGLLVLFGAPPPAVAGTARRPLRTG